MAKARKLTFNKNKCLIASSTGWEIDKEGYKGVWCTNRKGKKYFIRKGESALDAQTRIENNNIDSIVLKKYSVVRNQVERIGFAITNVFDGENEYWVKINKSEDDFDYEIIRKIKI